MVGFIDCNLGSRDEFQFATSAGLTTQILLPAQNPTGCQAPRRHHYFHVCSNNLQTQDWINKIADWTEHQKMMINIKKTKGMIINFTEDYEFDIRLKIKGENIERI